MNSRFQESIDDNAAMLREHELREITKPDATVRAFYLAKPGERAQSTLIVFTPEGIALMGDLTPNNHGDVSAIGYGLDWFASNLSTDYLCSKFFAKTWIPQRAIDRVREMAAERLEEYEDPKKQEALLEIAHDIDNHDIGQDGLICALGDIDIHDETYEIGMDYDPNKAGLLIAIQRRFAELWQARATEARKAG